MWQHHIMEHDALIDMNIHQITSNLNLELSSCTLFTYVKGIWAYLGVRCDVMHVMYMCMCKCHYWDKNHKVWEIKFLVPIPSCQGKPGTWHIVMRNLFPIDQKFQLQRNVCIPAYFRVKLMLRKWFRDKRCQLYRQVLYVGPSPSWSTTRHSILYVYCNRNCLCKTGITLVVILVYLYFTAL